MLVSIRGKHPTRDLPLSRGMVLGNPFFHVRCHSVRDLGLIFLQWVEPRTQHQDREGDEDEEEEDEEDEDEEGEDKDEPSLTTEDFRDKLATLLSNAGSGQRAPVTPDALLKGMANSGVPKTPPALLAEFGTPVPSTPWPQAQGSSSESSSSSESEDLKQRPKAAKPMRLPSGTTVKMFEEGDEGDPAVRAPRATIRDLPEPWFRVQGSGFRVQGLGFRV